ncbi:MAG: YSIRK-type signal peptide-containing protein, partial [Streptococcus sp.]|nr:YSIRK-type signal peptide-containing protein [Streptococcus sp.]
MKDIFNRRQRFSLRKYSIGVCSVLLGTALFAAGAQSASADEATAASGPAETAASEAAQPATTESSQSEAPAASKAYGEGASVPKIDPSGTAAATSETPAPATKKAEVVETPAATENKEAKAEEAAKPTKAEEATKPAKAEEATKPAPKTEAPKATATPAKTEEAAKPAKAEEATKPAASTRAATSESSEAASTSEAAAVALNPKVQPASLRATDVHPEDQATAEVRSATLDRAATDLTNAGALATSRSRRGKRALTDHNVTPVDVTTKIADNVKANPDMTDPNGASVHSQTIPAGYQAKEGDFYTFGIWNLTKYNERYNTNYYARAYKNFDSSTDTTVELIDKNTGAVVETHTVTATSGVQKFTTTTPKSNNELTLQVDYQAGAGQGPGKTDQPFIQMGFEVGPAIQALVAPGHNLTPAEQARFDAVYSARNSNDIINAVEPAYNGRLVTDTNFKIPANVEKTTYYKVVDKANPTYKETGKSVTTQDYKENGNETELAKYTLKAMEGQNFTASGERQFTKTEKLTDEITRKTAYKLYQTADANDKSGYVSRPYTVGTKFMDAERAGIKRIKEIVGEDGSVVVRVYLLDPKQQSKRSEGTLNTDGYMLLAETKPIKPGDYNKEELVVKKTPLNTIAFTDSKGVNYPNGKTVPFDFQWAAGYTPYKTVFVPFLGDNIGHLSPNEQLVRGVNGIGTNVDLLNSLTPYKQPIYYYDKTETIKVKPKVEKQLEGRALVDGEFSFKIKENSSSPGVEETVTNKDGKATFSELSFKKEGTYTYTITEVKGADKDVDYDAMEVTMTVKVTKDANGDLQASVKYTGEGGFKSSADDKIFNNYVVAPVKTKFDFSKALAGRELKEGEFSFVLKDSDGKTLQTKTNTKAGVVAFDDLTFDNTQVGKHKYTVEEVIPENKETGMTYDTMKAEVTITVTKQGHVLKATNTLPADTEFNNTFTPVATQAQFKFTKKLEGKELTKDAFTFELLENGNVIQTKKNAADGTIQFDAISYAAAGTHTYTVREKAGTDTNIDYDPMNAVVTVNVTKDAQTGLLNAAVTMPADTEFNNFAVAPVKTRFDFSKALAGRELKEGEFTFVLKDANGKTLQTKTNTKQGVVAFDNLTFDNTQVGVHKYTVEEVQGSEAGMTYDPMKAEVTITVTKEGHVLKATNALPADTEFNNTFTPAATQAQFKFTKRLEGKELTKDAFTFELLENGNVIQTKKNAADGSITFDAIEYNAVGEHTYTVREKAGTDTNIDYDSMNAVVTVNVTKNAATGLLSAAVTMPEDTEFNNYVVAPVKTKFDFSKKLAGRELKDGEFKFVLKDANGQEVETVANKKDGTVTFTEISFDNTKVGTHTYTVEEVIPATKEVGMTYDTMKATITVEVAKNGHALTTVTSVSSTGGVDDNGASTDGKEDKVFNNKITPPETPEFQPEKFVLNKEKFDLTGTKLMDDDDELQDEYTETNANPYADQVKNNEAENINTKTVERGDKLVYQVWLDTKNFTDKNNIQSVGISDTYDADKLTVNAADIKAYDSVTGVDVTSKFDITVANGVITATSKSSMNKSLGDADNTQVIDTTKFAFGRYYKFDIPATVKADVPGGVDIENKANQIVHVYNPVSKSVETPEKPTQKRVNSVPITAEFNFTKRLEGRALTAGEFTFALKDSDNVVIATATNDADGKIKFSPVEYTNKAGEKVTALKYKKGQEGTYTYSVTEVKGTDATVTYDTMKAEVTVTVSHDGTAKALVANVTEPADKEFNNTVTPPTEPKFQPEKYVLNTAKYSITDNKLLDDDAELTDKYGETNTDPYVDKTNNNEAENINTKTVNRGDKLYYQVWLDTTKFSATNKENVQSVGITDDFDETKVDVDGSAIKAYDSVTGDDVTNKFDIKVENGAMTATLKAGFTKSLGDADNTQVIDTTKFAFGRYYKFDIPATVKADVAGGVDIENTAAQVVNYYNPVSKTVEKPSKPTEKRVNSVPISIEFNFTKRLEGRELKENEFSFVLKDSNGKEVETVTNDKDGNVKFSALTFKKGQEGVHNYTVEEVAGTDATVTYDTMKATVTITVSHKGTAKALVATLGDIADKEFNNVVTPPTEPKFQPEKYVVSKEKYDITGDKLVDDDSELTDKYGETNTNPYVDGTSNNEAENLNTKTVERGSKLVYQVWLDTTKFDAANKDNIQTVGISDNYDEAKLNLNKADIKAYDSVTGAEVTDKFDITVNNGVITANLKAGFTKSLGDAENTQVIDTTKFAFGRYYKFDIPTTVKDDVVAGADIENTAAQVVNYYNPTTKKVEKPNKPTEKRVNNVPISVEFNFTKKLEGRELKANEFTFELKDSDNVVIATATNDADGNFKFTPVDYTNKAGKTVTALKYQKGQEGTYTYAVTEVKGTDSTVTYDEMSAVVTVKVSHDGTAKALITNVTDPADKEFNNKVTPPTEPKFQPEKYVVSKAKFDITGTKLVDDDSELTDKYGETNTNPYVDNTNNNEAENLNTKTVERGSKLYYQVWLDTTKFDAANKDNIQTVGITDNYDKDKLTVNASDIKVYDSVTGADVTTKFDISDNNGVLTANLKAGFTKSLGDTENTQIIDTTKFEFGRYYKFDIPATVKDDVVAGADIENKAAQVVNYYNPVSKTVEKPNKPTEKRVNSVPVPLDLKFTKSLEGRQLKDQEFTFVLKKDGNVVETVKNDATGKVNFTQLKFGKDDLGKTYNYTVEEVRGTDSTVSYDPMVATVKVVVSHDGTAKAIVANVTDAADKEFNNRVTPPEEPKFQPEKYVLNAEKFSITDNKLLDDDSELADKYADTNANPYVDGTANNEAENINTKTVKRGDKLVYQVWLDTTKFDAANKDNIQSVGISDDYDEAKLDLDSTKIKAYDSVTGAEVTDKFDIAVNNGVITATLKDGFT